MRCSSLVILNCFLAGSCFGWFMMRSFRCDAPCRKARRNKTYSGRRNTHCGGHDRPCGSFLTRAEFPGRTQIVRRGSRRPSRRAALIRARLCPAAFVGGGGPGKAPPQAVRTDRLLMAPQGDAGLARHAGFTRHSVDPCARRYSAHLPLVGSVFGSTSNVRRNNFSARDSPKMSANCD